MKSHFRKVRISPKKANIVAGLVRGKSAVEALDMLRFMQKKSARALYKAIHSAVANAEHSEQKLSRDILFVKEIIVNKGEVWRRYLPSPRGRALPLKKPTAHISITLEKK